MSNMLDQFTNAEQFKGGGSFIGKDVLKKTLKDGDNVYRIVGKGKVFYIHKFDAADKSKVTSICVKDEDGVGECPVCKKYREAWSIIKAVEKGESDDYSTDQIQMAEIVAGQRVNPNVGFKQSWGPKRMIALQVIDRDSNTNAKENHLSILCKSDYEFGISASKRGIYEVIVRLFGRYKNELKEHFQKGHDWFPFDVNLMREGKGMDTSYDKEKGDNKPLTAAELKYKRYDLDAITAPTSEKDVSMWLTSGVKKAAKKATVEVDEDEDLFDNEEDVPAPVSKPKIAQKKPAPVEVDEDEEEVVVAEQKKPAPKKAATRKPTPKKPAPVEEDVFGGDEVDVVSDDGEEAFGGSDDEVEITQPKKPVQKKKPVEAEIVDEDPFGIEEEVVEKPAPKKESKVKVKAKKEPEEEKDNCPSCDKLIPVTSKSCPYCKCEFEGYEDEAGSDEIPF